MISDEAIQAIRQKKLDSLAAKHLHVKSLAKLNRLNRIVDLLAIAVPVLFFAPRYLAKGTSLAAPVEAGWEALAAILLGVVILKLALRWEERALTHSKLLAENIFLIGQANDLLLVGPEKIPAESIPLFLRLAERSETADREAIGEPSEKEKQFAYREGLKELEGNASIRCPICNSSPWQFRPGSCQLCGNTPAPVQPNAAS